MIDYSARGFHGGVGSEEFQVSMYYVATVQYLETACVFVKGCLSGLGTN